VSLADALKFIQAAQENEGLRRHIADRRPDPRLRDLAAMGAELGFVFTTEELRAAFEKDWRLRRAFYEAQSKNR